VYSEPGLPRPTIKRFSKFVVSSSLDFRVFLGGFGGG